MGISLIVATDLNRGIGKNGYMPWGIIKKDLNFFKGKTMNNNVIMGRKTMEALPKGFLPNRKNIVLTNNGVTNNNVTIVHSIEEALNMCDKNKEIFIIGGMNIYDQFLNIADKIYLTKIHDTFDCDTHFPVLSDEWLVKYESDIHKDNYDLQFLIFERYV